MPVDKKVSTLVINQVPYDKKDEPTYSGEELYFIEDNLSPNKFVKTNADSELITTDETMPTKTSELTNDSGFITSSAITGKEDTSNKVTSISSSSTNTQYPSAKCVYDIVGNIEATLQEIRGVQ